MTSSAKIGLLTLIGLIVLGAFILKIEDLSLGGEPVQTVRARVPSAAGLDRKAPVRIAGVRVGRVEEIRLDGGSALLEMSLAPEVRLHLGASARVTSLGMLGDTYLELIPGDPAAPLLGADAVLDGDAPPTFDDVLRVATDIGADLKEVTGSLRSSLGGAAGAETLAEIVENIRELTGSMRELIAANQENVNQTTDNFRAFSATLRDELPVIAEKMSRLADQLSGVVEENRDDLGGSLENIRELSAKLQTSADNLNQITAKIAAGEGSLGKLVNEDETVDNLNDTLVSIQDGVTSLKDTVGRFQRFRLDMTIRGEALPGLEEDASRTAFGFDLWTTDRRFFRAEGVDAPYGRTRTTTEQTTTTLPDGSVVTTTRENITTRDQLLINAQIGYTVKPSTTVRAGLFESTGGFGVDYQLDVARRPLRLTLEAYDFNRPYDLKTHLRLEGRYFLNRNLFLMAGFDDALESDRSSVLVGGGVVWRDEDLKYSLGLAGSALN